MNPILANIIKGLVGVLPVLPTLFNSFKKNQFIAPTSKKDAIKVFFDETENAIKQVTNTGTVIDLPTKKPNYMQLIIMLSMFAVMVLFFTGKIDFTQLMELLNFFDVK